MNLIDFNIRALEGEDKYSCMYACQVQGLNAFMKCGMKRGDCIRVTANILNEVISERTSLIRMLIWH